MVGKENFHYSPIEGVSFFFKSVPINTVAFRENQFQFFLIQLPSIFIPLIVNSNPYHFYLLEHFLFILKTSAKIFLIFSLQFSHRNIILCYFVSNCCFSSLTTPLPVWKLIPPVFIALSVNKCFTSIPGFYLFPPLFTSSTF